MGGTAYFIRRRTDACSLVKLHPDGREEILETGLSLAEAEMLYFICLCEPVFEAPAPDIAADVSRTRRRRVRQLAFRF